jgi:hypothetical protein
LATRFGEFWTSVGRKRETAQEWLFVKVVADATYSHCKLFSQAQSPLRFFYPRFNPQSLAPCPTPAYLASPRDLVSCYKA